MTDIEQDRESTHNGVTATLLDCFAFPIFVVTAARDVLERNRAADALCTCGDALRIVDGRLVVANAEAGEELVAALQVTAPQTFMTLAAGKGTKRLRLLIRRVPSPTPGETTHTLMVVVLTADRTLDSGLLAGIYGLTPTEGRVAVALLQGGEVGEVADALCVSIHTARSHVRNLLSKTGTNSQRELVRVLALEFGALSFEPGRAEK
jgi:DNA-binding CsgD family transcriptional regulator